MPAKVRKGKKRGAKEPEKPIILNGLGDLNITPCNMDLADLDISGKYLTPEGNQHGDYVVKTRGKRVHKPLSKDKELAGKTIKILEAIEEHEEVEDTKKAKRGKESDSENDEASSEEGESDENDEASSEGESDVSDDEASIEEDQVVPSTIKKPQKVKPAKVLQGKNNPKIKKVDNSKKVIKEKLPEKPKVEAKKTRKVVKKVENPIKTNKISEKTVVDRPKRIVKKAVVENSDKTVAERPKRIKKAVVESTEKKAKAPKKVLEKPKKVIKETDTKKNNLARKKATNASKKDPKTK